MIYSDKSIVAGTGSLQAMPTEYSVTKTMGLIPDIKPIINYVQDIRVNEGQDIAAPRKVELLGVNTSEAITKITGGASSVLLKGPHASLTPIAHHATTVPFDLRKSLESIDLEQERWIALGEARDKILEGCNPTEVIKEYAIDPSTTEGQKILREFAWEFASKDARIFMHHPPFLY